MQVPYFDALAPRLLGSLLCLALPGVALSSRGAESAACYDIV
jgi:hypothetical protein